MGSDAQNRSHVILIRIQISEVVESVFTNLFLRDLDPIDSQKKTWTLFSQKVDPDPYPGE